MSHLIYHAYEKTGADKARQFGYTQSVKVENTVYISGQGEWNTQYDEGTKGTRRTY